ncbi:MAG: hypothetical protein R6X34_04735, partial [Chloroflexota bacterium]
VILTAFDHWHSREIFGIYLFGGYEKIPKLHSGEVLEIYSGGGYAKIPMIYAHSSWKCWPNSYSVILFRFFTAQTSCLSLKLADMKVQNGIEEYFYLVLTSICIGMLRLMTASLGLRLYGRYEFSTMTETIDLQALIGELAIAFQKKILSCLAKKHLMYLICIYETQNTLGNRNTQTGH